MKCDFSAIAVVTSFIINQSCGQVAIAIAMFVCSWSWPLRNGNAGKGVQNYGEILEIAGFV